MADAANQRAESLAVEAKACIENRELSKAYQLATQALSLAPKNANVLSVVLKLQESDSNHQILPLCRSFLQDGDHEAGEKALKFLREKEPIPSKDVDQLATMFFDQNGRSQAPKVDGVSSLINNLTAALVLHSQAIRSELATRFAQTYAVGDTSRLFNLMYLRGEASFDALVQVIINESVWASPAQHRAAKRDAFQLSLGKLLEPALDHPLCLMQLVTRLLATHAADLRAQPQNNLASLLIPDNFGIVLTWLDIRSSQEVRSQATLATTKFLDEMKDGNKGEETVHGFVKDHVTTHADDMIIAFSAAAACFPLCPQTVSKLFLTPGFLEGLVPSLEHVEFDTRTHRLLEKASLELMSAACVDKSCREALNNKCAAWLDDTAHTHEEEEFSSLAALVLSKIGLQEVTAESSGVVANIDGLSGTLMNMTLNATSDSARSTSIEGLAYSSLKPKVKEEILANSNLVTTLIDTLKASRPTDPAVFGILTIFTNITAYRPNHTEEQIRMSQLRAYANNSRPAPPDPLDSPTYVTERCKKVLAAGLVPVLTSHHVKSMSAVGMDKTVSIISALAREQRHRGLLTQQGAVRLLLQAIERLESMGASSLEAPFRTAAHGLACILISVNPVHVFGPTVSALSAVRAICTLLQLDTEAEYRDMLPVYEALLALTNLASTNDDTLGNFIVQTSWSQIEDLLLATHMLVRQASVELVCNLMVCPQGIEKYADGSPRARTRLHILIASADGEDLRTRQAAGGALAMVTEFDKAAKVLLESTRGVETLLALCAEDQGEMDDELSYRGVASLLNLVSISDENISKRAIEAINRLNGLGILKDLLTKSRNPQVIGAGAELFKKLLGEEVVWQGEEEVD